MLDRKPGRRRDHAHRGQPSQKQLHNRPKKVTTDCGQTAHAFQWSLPSATVLTQRLNGFHGEERRDSDYLPSGAVTPLEPSAAYKALAAVVAYVLGRTNNNGNYQGNGRG